MIRSKLGSYIGSIFLIYFLFSFSVYAESVKIEDARKQDDKVNVRKVGKDYGLLVSEGSTTLQVRVDFAGGSNPVYIGWAEPGANYTHAKWRIVKIEWDGMKLLEMQFADQISTFTKTWNSRTSYDYEPDN